MVFLRKSLTIFMVIFVINGCNKQDMVEVPNASIESEMKALGEAFRFGARMQYTASRNSGVVENSDELEEGMIEYLKNEYGEDVEVALAEFKSSEAFAYLDQTMADLSVSNQNNSGRLAAPGLVIEEELIKISQTFEHVNTTENFKSYVDGVNNKIITITNDFMDEINQNSVEINGEYFISADLLNDNLHATRLKSKITQIEAEIIADGSLTNEEKQNLFHYTTAMLMNVDNVVDYTILLDPDELTMGRTSGFFKKIGNLFKRALTAVVTVITTAFITTVGVIAGFFAGGIPGAVIGGVVGLSVGLEFSQYLSCNYAISSHICGQCMIKYPNMNPC